MEVTLKGTTELRLGIDCFTDPADRSSVSKRGWPLRLIARYIYGTRGESKSTRLSFNTHHPSFSCPGPLLAGHSHTRRLRTARLIRFGVIFLSHA
jgi:hypothetical protein